MVCRARRIQAADAHRRGSEWNIYKNVSRCGRADLRLLSRGSLHPRKALPRGVRQQPKEIRRICELCNADKRRDTLLRVVDLVSLSRIDFLHYTRTKDDGTVGSMAASVTRSRSVHTVDGTDHRYRCVYSL